MKSKLLKFSLRVICVIALVWLLEMIGSELITLYEMRTTGTLTRSELSEDMGFGMLLMMGFIIELIIGITLGILAGNKIIKWLNLSKGTAEPFIMGELSK